MIYNSIILSAIYFYLMDVFECLWFMMAALMIFLCSSRRQCLGTGAHPDLNPGSITSLVHSFIYSTNIYWVPAMF